MIKPLPGYGELCYELDAIGACFIGGASAYGGVGTVRGDIADALGLPRSCRVVAGAGDNAAVAVGTGTVGDGNCIISLGTSGTIFISSERFGVDPNNALHAFAHAGGGWHLMGCMLSAASCNKWLCDEIYLTDD